MALSCLLIILFQYEDGLGNGPLDLLFSSIRADDVCFSCVLTLCGAQSVANINNFHSNNIFFSSVFMKTDILCFVWGSNVSSLKLCLTRAYKYEWPSDTTLTFVT